MAIDKRQRLREWNGWQAIKGVGSCSKNPCIKVVIADSQRHGIFSINLGGLNLGGLNLGGLNLGGLNLGGLDLGGHQLHY